MYVEEWIGRLSSSSEKVDTATSTAFHSFLCFSISRALNQWNHLDHSSSFLRHGYSNIFTNVLVCLVSTSSVGRSIVAVENIDRLLISLLLVILLALNIGGVIQYLKKRRQYLNDLNRDIPMNERPTPTDREQTKTKNDRRTKSALFLSRTRSFMTNSTVAPSSFVPTVKSPMEPVQFNLEIFRRQALQEHNRTRAINQLLPLRLSDALNIYAQVNRKHEQMSNRRLFAALGRSMCTNENSPVVRIELAFEL